MQRTTGSSLLRPFSLLEEEELLRRSDADLTAENEEDRRYNSSTTRSATVASTVVTVEKDKLSAIVSNTEKKSSDSTVLDMSPTICPVNKGPSHHTVDKTELSNCPFAGLHVVDNTHQVSMASETLLKYIGGVSRLNRSITRFYKYAFANPHLVRFFTNTSDPHAKRLSSWIAEKMGDKYRPWTRERRNRDLTPKILAGGRSIIVRDRSSAHVAAWFSPKRETHKVGRHFKLDDCRLWLRLHFLAAREEGLLEHANFRDWYTRFLAHFMRVYERTAPQFVRQAMRWSEDKKRVARYHEAVVKGLPEFKGEGVLGLSLGKALQQIPKAEWAENTTWPYDER